jgi:hypothetical protein
MREKFVVSTLVLRLDDRRVITFLADVTAWASGMLPIGTFNFLPRILPDPALTCFLRLRLVARGLHKGRILGVGHQRLGRVN